MPLLRGSVTYGRCTAEYEERPKDFRRWLSRGFRKQAFEAIDRDSDEDRSAGWVELGDPDAVELAAGSLIHGEYVLLSFRVDTIRVPRQLLNPKVDAWSKEYEEANGRKPKRSEKRETKDLLHRRLRRRAFPSTRTYDVSWSLTTDQIQIWTSSRKIIEEIQIALEEAFSIGVHPQTVSSIATSMGYEPDDLTPTAALVGDFDDTEVSRYAGGDE